MNALVRRKETIAATPETLLEYDAFLYNMHTALYTPERRAAMALDIANARDELSILDKQLRLSENLNAK